MKETIGERIRKRREELNMSQDELALRLGYKSRSSITKIEKDGRDLPQKKIYAISQILNVSPAYIMGWKEDTTSVMLPYPEATRTLNIYQPLSCGSGMFVDDNVITTMSIPETMLPKGKKLLFGQYASGDSMIGKNIDDGDLLVFSKEDCQSGDVGCFCIDDNIATCKTLRIVGNQIMLMPANDKYEPIIVDPMQYRCVGKLVLVIKKYQNG